MFPFVYINKKIYGCVSTGQHAEGTQGIVKEWD